MDDENPFTSKQYRDRYISDVVEALEKLIDAQEKIIVSLLKTEAEDNRADSLLEVININLDASLIPTPTAVASDLLSAINKRTTVSGERHVTFTRHPWSTSETRSEKEGKRVVVAADLLKFCTNMRNELVVGLRYSTKTTSSAARNGWLVARGAVNTNYKY